MDLPLINTLLILGIVTAVYAGLENWVFPKAKMFSFVTGILVALLVVTGLYAAVEHSVGRPGRLERADVLQCDLGGVGGHDSGSSGF